MAAVLVIGASRGIGLETVRAALAAGHRVRALARSSHTIAIADERLEKMPGDALDPKTVERAVDGREAVIQCLGVAFSPEMMLRGTTLFSRATRVLVDAMQAKGVHRLIAVTGLGAGDSRDVGPLLYTHLVFPLLLKRVYDDKDIQEQIVRASGLDWTIVRPGGLTSGPATGRYRVLTDPASWRVGFVSRADVAGFLVRAISDTSTVRQTPVVIGG